MTLPVTLGAGIFVGGRGRRMGGVPKGLLVTQSGETIVERWARLFGDLGVAYVLVGANDAYAAYAGRGIAIPDDPAAEGPLGGLLALLEHAVRAQRAANSRSAAVIAVACDMPYVSPTLVRRLIDAPPAAIAAARREDRWEPFFARYEVATVLPVARARAAEGKRSLQGLLDACAAAELVLGAGEHDELRDWDAPEDLVT